MKHIHSQSSTTKIASNLQTLHFRTNNYRKVQYPHKVNSGIYAMWHQAYFPIQYELVNTTYQLYLNVILCIYQLNILPTLFRKSALRKSQGQSMLERWKILRCSRCVAHHLSLSSIIYYCFIEIKDLIMYYWRGKVWFFSVWNYQFNVSIFDITKWSLNCLKKSILV